MANKQLSTPLQVQISLSDLSILYTNSMRNEGIVCSDKGVLQQMQNGYVMMSYKLYVHSACNVYVYWI